MEETKFTDEEMQQLTALQQEFNLIVIKFGQLNIDKIALEQTENNLKEQYKQLREKENTLASVLSSKYGQGKLDPNTGIFTPIEQTTQQ